MSAALLLPHVNVALAHLGEPALAALDEEGARASRMNVHLADNRLVAALQRRYLFGFCKADVVPPLEPVEGIGRFKKRYRLPADCLQVRSVDGLDEDAWDVQTVTVNPERPDDIPAGRVLACNIDTPLVAYVRLVTNPAAWDALFGDVFALELALRAAPSFGKSKADMDALRAELDRAAAPARRRSAQERARSALPSSAVPFITARGPSRWRL